MKAYFKEHPISYWSALGPFLFVAFISTFIWFFIVVDVKREFFESMLNEQKAQKWLWLSMSISISYLSIKNLICGPVVDHSSSDIKIIGVYMGNTTLGILSGSIGIFWGAMIPLVVYSDIFPSNDARLSFFFAGCIALMVLALLYFLYLTLLPLVNTPMHNRMKTVTSRVLLVLFTVPFCLGRILEVVYFWSS